MTTINCSSNCIHQKEGKCTLENTSISPVVSNSDCVFYQPISLKIENIKK